MQRDWDGDRCESHTSHDQRIGKALLQYSEKLIGIRRNVVLAAHDIRRRRHQDSWTRVWRRRTRRPNTNQLLLPADSKLVRPAIQLRNLKPALRIRIRLPGVAAVRELHHDVRFTDTGSGNDLTLQNTGAVQRNVSHLNGNCWLGRRRLRELGRRRRRGGHRARRCSWRIGKRCAGLKDEP